ncbi:hypothetical protein ACWD6I_20670, partial [Streptomyces sp. NPDC002454]
ASDTTGVGWLAPAAPVAVPARRGPECDPTGFRISAHEFTEHSRTRLIQFSPNADGALSRQAFVFR